MQTYGETRADNRLSRLDYMIKTQQRERETWYKLTLICTTPRSYIALNLYLSCCIATTRVSSTVVARSDPDGDDVEKAEIMFYERSPFSLDRAALKHLLVV